MKIAPQAAASHGTLAVMPHLVRIEGYYTGDFIARVIAQDGFYGGVLLEVVDPLRPVPDDVCPFPGCGLGLYHEGEHAPGEILRAGSVVSIWSHNCRIRLLKAEGAA